MVGILTLDLSALVLVSLADCKPNRDNSVSHWKSKRLCISCESICTNGIIFATGLSFWDVSCLEAAEGSDDLSANFCPSRSMHRSQEARVTAPKSRVE